MMPAVTREWGLNVPLGPTRKTWAWVMSQWGVSVAGFIRPRTAPVHSVTNQVRGLPPEDFGRPWPLTATVCPVRRPWLGVTLTTIPGVPAWAGSASTTTAATPARATAATATDHRYMPRTSEPGFTPGRPRGGDASFHRGPRDSTRPRPGQGGELRPQVARLI